VISDPDNGLQSGARCHVRLDRRNYRAAQAAGESISKLVEIRDTAKFGEEVSKLYAQILSACKAR